jgi:spore maturation protein CgeB
VLRQLAGEDRFRIHRDPSLASACQGDEVYADDYARALTGSRIGLGFLRQVCPDQHTTRSFEIPACGSMLLADRTGEHREFFEEGKDAEFFGSATEMMDKLKFYASNTEATRRMAAAGHDRCVRSQYAYVYRVKNALQNIRAA